MCRRVQARQVEWVYEVIPAGWKCRVYFDLEYIRAHYPQRTMADDNTALQQILEAANRRVVNEGGQVDVEACVVLDASNDVKFSIHLILATQQGRDVAAIKILINAVADALPPFAAVLIDRAPYNRNQQFRVVFASKLVNNAPWYRFW